MRGATNDYCGAMPNAQRVALYGYFAGLGEPKTGTADTPGLCRRRLLIIKIHTSRHNERQLPISTIRSRCPKAL